MNARISREELMASETPTVQNKGQEAERVEKVKERLSGSMHVCIGKRAEAGPVQRQVISRAGIEQHWPAECQQRQRRPFGNGAQRLARIGIAS